MTKIEINRPGESSTKELKTSYTSLIASSHTQKNFFECLTGRTSLSHVVGVLQISYLLSCAGVWRGQHYYAIATVIIYKSH